MRRLCVIMLCTLALSAQAATWQFKDATLTYLGWDGLPLIAPGLHFQDSSITGVFSEQGGQITSWDILTANSPNDGFLAVEFTSVPPGTHSLNPTCVVPDCQSFAQVLSPTALQFHLNAGHGPGSEGFLILALAVPLGVGVDTIELVPGMPEPPPWCCLPGKESRVIRINGIGFGRVAGSIIAIPELQTIAPMALGLALLVCLHMRHVWSGFVSKRRAP